ncbi:tripartite ATP-independent periplasmic transporters, DctQ component [Roseovarius sp. A-2]|uniref:TRAP transporter small permease subunit n=1 Tax=Roseovarius sp. A-2 TaxID=1570360 RepID=UPI0009B53277|nr:TRAP transporter small permease subunit [Roseovarius sp. A-2]GAW34173.1 tripartite ATP-independent periplasmic transporters, DctQ component [Roseovarius sp. A-2]
MTGLLHLAFALDRVVRLVGRNGARLVLLLIATVMFDVIVRKVPGVHGALFGSVLGDHLSAVKLREFSWHLHSVIFLTALGYTYLENAHVRLDILRERMTARRRAWIELAGILVALLPYMAMMIFFAWGFVHQSWINGEGSTAASGIPHRWIIKSALLIGFGMTFLAGLSIALRIVVFLRAKADLAGSRLTTIIGQPGQDA